jgi:O-antigen ligase
VPTPLRNLLVLALVGAVAVGLLDLGGVGTRGLYQLFLWVLAAALLATWTLPVRWPGRPIALAALVAGLYLTARVVLEPPLTGRGYVLAALAAVAYLCSRWLAAADRGAAQRLAWGLVAIGGVEACWGLLQERPISGSLFNPNHFAGFLNLTLGLALGSLHGVWRSRPLAALFGGGALLMVLGVLSSGSRAGVAVLLLTLAFVALLVALRRLRERRPALRWTAAALLLIGFFAFGTYRALTRSDVSDIVRRLTIYQDTVDLVADHSWTGVGAGMYAWRFRPYQSFDTDKRFDHAHQDFLEVAAEWGLPIALLLFVFFGWQVASAAEGFLADRREDARDRGLLLGASAAATSMLAHGLVDFPLQIPVNLTAFAMVLGLCRAGRDRAAADPEPQLRPLVVRAVVSVLLVGLGAGAGRQLAETEIGRRALDAEDLEAVGDADPAWPMFHFRLGILRRDLPDRRDLAVARRALERTVELNPYNWRYWFELGRLYESAGQLDLAETAYREALRLNPRSNDDRHRVAGFYLRRGDFRQGLILLRQALAEDDELLTPGAELLLSLGMSPAELGRWWPRHPAARRVLVEVLSRDPGVEAPAAAGAPRAAAWQDWLAAVPPPTLAGGGFYVDRLLAAGAAAEARRAWIDLAAVSGLVDEDFMARRNDLWNGGFELELSGAALGWKFPEAGGTRLGLAPVGKGGGLSLILEFYGEEDFRRVRQQAVVDPATGYTLRFLARCESLVAPGGVRLQVLDVASREVLYTSEPIADSMGWTRFEGQFETAGPQVLVRLAAPNDADGSRTVSGKLWLDSVALHRSDLVPDPLSPFPSPRHPSLPPGRGAPPISPEARLGVR